MLCLGARIMEFDLDYLQAQSAAGVLLVNLAKYYGGTEVRILDTAKSLHGRYPYDVAVLNGSPLHERLSQNNLNVIPLFCHRADPRMLWFLWRLLRKKKYGVVDAHNSQSHLWGLVAAKLANIPVRVATVHSSYRYTETTLKAWLYELVLSLVSSLGVRFVVVSQAVFDYLVSLRIPQKCITLIPNAIALPTEEELCPCPGLINSLGWPQSSYMLITVGRLEPVKGLSVLIESLAQVVMSEPRVRLLIVGEGRSQIQLQQQVIELGLQKHVVFAGFRKDIKNLLVTADLFCMPSLSEGLPYALLEACTCKVPVLATSVGGMADFLEDQVSALLVPANDSASLAQNILMLMHDSEFSLRLAEAAYQKVAVEMSLPSMIDQTLMIYNERNETIPDRSS